MELDTDSHKPNENLEDESVMQGMQPTADEGSVRSEVRLKEVIQEGDPCWGLHRIVRMSKP